MTPLKEIKPPSRPYIDVLKEHIIEDLMTLENQNGEKLINSVVVRKHGDVYITNIIFNTPADFDYYDKNLKVEVINLMNQRIKAAHLEGFVSYKIVGLSSEDIGSNPFLKDLNKNEVEVVFETESLTSGQGNEVEVVLETEPPASSGHGPSFSG